MKNFFFVHCENLIVQQIQRSANIFGPLQNMH